MEELGFTRGLVSGCLFYHEVRDLRRTVYGDDFTTVGPKDALDWFEEELEKKYSITRRARMGPGPQYTKEATLLNRVIKWTEYNGIEIEADPRQGERLVSQMNLVGANTITTPGVKTTTKELEADEMIYDQCSAVYRAVGGNVKLYGS